MKIYPDNCCFNRPYGEQSYETIRMETKAKLAVRESINNGLVDLVRSFMLDFENSANPFDDNRETISEWKNKAIQYVDARESIRKKAKDLTKHGVKSKDALHLSCAIESGCDYFLATDRQ
jgi:predicted nucleic acid-binding protein